ncbi:Gfo/Idh/MocA family protein [Bacteroidota bacterium]
MKSSSIQPVSIVLVAVSGYGYFYLKTLLEEVPPEQYLLKAVVDLTPEKSGYFGELKNRNIPIFFSLEEFYSSGGNADLVVISSPNHFHASQTCLALRNKSNVLCDKPLAITVQEVKQIIDTRNNTGNWVMVGFQWCYSRAILELKKDIMNGVFGKPKRFKTLCLLPRDFSYYSRNDWAGKIRGKKGEWILDSPAQNAMSHFLHNLLFILGNELSSAVRPVKVCSEVYKSYDIENFDTIACRIFTENDIEILFYASHSTFKNIDPMFSLEFENAIVNYDKISDQVTAVDSRGKWKLYGSPYDTHQFQKLFDSISNVNNPVPVVCAPETVIPHTICVNGIQESISEIPSYPVDKINSDTEKKRLWMNGLGEVLTECYDKGLLPNEAGFPWSIEPGETDLKNYNYFPRNSFHSSENKK